MSPLAQDVVSFSAAGACVAVLIAVAIVWWRVFHCP